jgi:1-acyl-sn-glycerol-3-phosphate acyltransferase
MAFAFVVALPLVFLTITVFPRPQAWQISQRIYRAWFAALGIKVEAEGLEFLETSAPYILMGNHVNYLDQFILCTVLPLPVIGVEARERFRIPLYGSLMRRWGNLPIDRKDREQAKRFG